MILADVRKYFSDRAFAMGFRKHYDGFATDNIPGTKFNKSFHIESFRFDGSGQNHLDVQIVAPVVVRLYFKGYNDVDEGIEVATNSGELYIEDVLASENRLTQAGIKNVRLNGISVEPYASTNDNYVVCKIELTAYLFKGIC